jgi:hypothetical protein
MMRISTGIIRFSNQKKGGKEMMKKMMIRLTLVLALVALTTPVWAASCPDVLLADENLDAPSYYYAIDGNLKLSVNFPSYVTATITLPKLANFGDFEGFYFYSDNTLYDDLFYTYTEGLPIGTWEQNGCTIYIYFEDLVTMVQGLFVDSGIEVEPVGSTYTTAKISSRDGTNSGKLTLKFNVYSDIVDGNISITLTFKGYPTEFYYSSDKKASVKKGKASLSPEIKNFLSSALSKLPKKGAAPQLVPSH